MTPWEMRVHWLVNAILLVCRFTLLLRGQTLRQAADEDGLLPGRRLARRNSRSRRMPLP
ncbi:MAG: hypothetical protein ABSF15_10290 [Candidatus Sulfotelmatobacter sp.]